MNRPKLFAVYTAKFPFLDSNQDKVRPVIVVSESHGPHKVVAIVPVSSQTMKESVDVDLHHWKQAGLIKPSIARTHRITTTLQSNLVGELGLLNERDTRNIQDALRKLLSL